MPRKKRTDVVKVARPAQYDWQHRRMPRACLEQHRLVVIDDTAVQTNLMRTRGRSLRRIRLKAGTLFGHWRTRTFIAGLRIDELSASWLWAAPMNRAEFYVCIETQRAPTRQRGDIVIADSPSCRKSVKAQAFPRAQASWVRFVPAYRSDFYPIETTYSKLKAYLRHPKARTLDALLPSVAQIFELFRPEECRNLSKLAGCVASSRDEDPAP